MKRSKKVSIIVPVYNTANYLEKCLNSIQLQTYKNFEVLLVNDGSTDNSREICESFCRSDLRFRLFNQINSGLSESRNKGIHEAQGDLILFVDSDDYIDINLLEYSINILEKFNVDTVIFSYYITLNGEKKLPSFKDPDFGIIPSEQALIELLKGSFGSYSWKILTHKKLYTDFNILFPRGRQYEDTATTYKILAFSKNIYLSSQKLYYYEQRINSITHIHNDDDLTDMIKTFSEMHSFIQQKFPDVEHLLVKLEFNMIFMLLIRMGNWESKLSVQYSKIEKSYIKKAITHLEEIIKKYNITLKGNYYLHIKLTLLKMRVFPVLVFLKNHIGIT
ncbi:Putative glycosyltransferase EpsH [Leuconostoc suionicum]|uniref:Glycosyltransferase EpsH n=1 Tax=Leuconostoc suionicum TaxID=1511761 RepID=A0A2N9K737_9LACO|nr:MULTISPECIES: glycosyltransferase family 2 protein [Leuconostoc]AHF19421.1 putative glycosyl transferase [Leuconostoc mesenteroides KFRI-MG]MCU4664499.1 glycosyltransferase [Leuconostoc mesenteroides]SPD91177.1 Putative glycosyltransferase EpsH [Leuconostoc suionicum]SPE06402.1 Putative glycosyltransferase EpsH [Leuconostoc suionicum]SPH02891.1 Putative glycosyltransferase EpsH [Leuconostoc suionicum]